MAPKAEKKPAKKVVPKSKGKKTKKSSETYKVNLDFLSLHVYVRHAISRNRRDTV